MLSILFEEAVFLGEQDNNNPTGVSLDSMSAVKNRDKWFTYTNEIAFL